MFCRYMYSVLGEDASSVEVGLEPECFLLGCFNSHQVGGRQTCALYSRYILRAPIILLYNVSCMYRMYRINCGVYPEESTYVLYFRP